MNPHTGRDFVQFGKTESVLNKGAKKIALLFNPPPVLSLETIISHKLNITCPNFTFIHILNFVSILYYFLCTMEIFICGVKHSFKFIPMFFKMRY